MDYTSRYGLEFNPFIKNVKNEVLINTSEYQEVEYRLNNLLNIKGFGLITGGSGRGKTTAVRNWSKKLNEGQYKVIYISLSTLTVVEFYRQLAGEFGIDPCYRKPDNFKLIQDAINSLVLDKRITPVIILDEANYIKTSILNDLKILFNFEMDSKDRAVILLVGLQQLNNTLRLKIHEPLRQRVIMNYNMEELKKEEAKKYINEKLKQAGSYQDVFDSTAIEAIINASNGIARNINKLCNASLVIGNVKNVNIINSEIVMMAFNEIELG